MNLFDDLAEVCRREVPLGPLTWFRLGGPAEILAEPRTEDQLGTIVHRCRETGTQLRVLGLGANVLVSDEGVRGVVVRLCGAGFTKTEFGEGVIRAGAGADLTKLVKTAVKRGWSGIEQIAGIPGTVGGGIRMNCGGKYGEIGGAVRSVRVMNGEGGIEERSRAAMRFEYRKSGLGDEIVLGASFDAEETDGEELGERFREIWEYKQATQPPLGASSVGCIFKNPEGEAAGALIDRAGLKGYRSGSAWVSDRHANFVLAEEGGRAADVKRLIEEIRARVEQESGIRLETEVQMW